MTFKMQGKVMIVCLMTLLIFPRILYANSSIWDTQVLKKGIPKRSISSQAMTLDMNGNPHLLSSSDNLYYSWFDGTRWNSEQVLPAGTSGSSAQIAICPHGTIHCIFYIYISGVYVHAWKSEIGWEFDVLEDDYLKSISIRIDSNGKPHIAYFTQSDTIVHAVWNNGVWEREEFSSPDSSAHGLGFDLDSMGQPHLCFDRAGDIIHFFRNNSMWFEETVMENVSVSGNLQLRMDHSDNAHIAFLRNTNYSNNKTLHYLYQQSGNWIEVIMGDDKYEGLCMFLDNNDLPHFAFLSDRTLIHLSSYGNGWDRELIDSQSKYEGSVSGISGKEGITHILASNSTFSLLSNHRRGQSGWEQQVISTWGSYRNANIVVDRNSDIHTLYTGFSGNQLEYGFLKDGNWHFEVLDNGMGDGSGQCCIAFDDARDLHISYYNARNKTVYHAIRKGNEWQKEVVFEGETVFDSKMIASGQGRLGILISTDSNLYLFRKYSDVWERDIFEPGAYRSVSIFLDSSEKLHLAYYRANGGSWDTKYSLFYRYLEDRNWVEELVDGVNAGTGLETVKVMVSSAGIPLIGYARIRQGTHSQSQLAMYGFRDNDGWHLDHVDSATAFSWILDTRENPCFLMRDRLLFSSDQGQEMTSVIKNFYSMVIDTDSLTVDLSGRLHMIAGRSPDLFYARQALPVQGVRLEMPSNSVQSIWQYVFKYLPPQ